MKTTTLFLTTLLLLSISFTKQEDTPLTDEQLEKLEKESKRSEQEEATTEEPEYLNRKTFMEEYNKSESEFPEVEASRRFFPEEDEKISRERYAVLLKMFVDGSIHDMEIHEDIRDEANKQIEEHIEEFLTRKKDHVDEFGLEDYIEDAIEAKYHQWLEKAYPEIDPEIEGEDL